MLPTPVLLRTSHGILGLSLYPLSGQNRISWVVPHRSQLFIPSQWPIRMGWDGLGCPTPSHTDPNCSSHPNDPSGWDGIAWDVPHHPTQIPTVHPIPMTSVRSSWGSLGDLPSLLYSTGKWIYIAFMEISSKLGSQKTPELPLDLTLPMTHRDGMGLPGLSHTITPRSQLFIPSQWPIGMGGTVGIKASGGGMVRVRDIPGSPVLSRSNSPWMGWLRISQVEMVWHSPMLSPLLHEGMWDSQNPMGLL